MVHEEYQLNEKGCRVLTKIMPESGGYDVLKVRDDQAHGGQSIVRMVRNDYPPRLEIIVSSKPEGQLVTHAGPQLTHECFLLSVSEEPQSAWLKSYGIYRDVIGPDRVRRQEWLASSRQKPVWANEGSLYDHCDFDCNKNRASGLEKLERLLFEIGLSRGGRNF